MKGFVKKLRYLALAGLLASLMMGCAGQTGIIPIGSITVGGGSYSAYAAAHGDANGIDTKYHYLFDNKNGNLVSSGLAADKGMNKYIIPAAIGAVGDVGSAFAFGAMIGKQGGGSGGGATVIVDNVNAQAQKGGNLTAIQKGGNLTAIQKTDVRQKTDVKTGNPGHGHGDSR